MRLRLPRRHKQRCVSQTAYNRARMADLKPLVGCSCPVETDRTPWSSAPLGWPAGPAVTMSPYATVGRDGRPSDKSGPAGKIALTGVEDPDARQERTRLRPSENPVR